MSRLTRHTYQLIRDEARVAELMLMQYNKREIKEILEVEWGYDLTDSAVYSAMEMVKGKWTEKLHMNSAQWLNMELARVDALEAELWRAVRRRLDPKTKTVIKKIAKRIAEEEDGDPELMLRMVTETVTMGQDDAPLFAQIARQHEERRKLLGLYSAPAIQSTEAVKSYRVVSPDDWPDEQSTGGKIIEGEFSES